MMEDRDLIDKSSDSFVSFVRYYKEHELTFIFNINSLDLGAVAYSFHLFKVPRVKEILGKSIKFTNTEIDLENIPYKDSNKGNQKMEQQIKRKEKFEQKKQLKEEQEILK